MEANYKKISLQKIQDDKYQTRAFLDDDSFTELIESIRVQGVLQPICVRTDGEKFVVMAGHRRFAAAKYLGLESIPCGVLDNNKCDPWAIAFHENVYRKDMTPIEEAHFVAESLEKGPYTAEELSKQIRKSVSWIRDKVTIVAWPKDVAAAVHAGKISLAAAKNLAEIKDDAARLLLVDYAVDNGATARITAAWLQGYKANKPLENPGEIEPNEPLNIQTPQAPYAPCVVCDEKLKMAEMSYLPICPPCQTEVISKIRESYQQAK